MKRPKRVKNYSLAVRFACLLWLVAKWHAEGSLPRIDPRQRYT